MKKMLLPFCAMLMMPLTIFASPTERRGAVEFGELYMQRFTKYQYNNGKDYDTNVFGGGMRKNMYDPDKFAIYSTAGNMIIQSEDYTVSDLYMVLTEYGADAFKNEGNKFSCVMALSALEYNTADAALLEIVNDNELVYSKDVLENEVFQIWNEVMADFDETIKTEEFLSGDEILMYSANYDYYIAYVKDQPPSFKTYIFFIAREHE